MNMFGRLALVWGLSVWMLAVLGGCGTSDVDDSEQREWTVREGALQLQQDLHVSDNEQFYLGDIRDVAIDDSGHIYVADGQAHHVKILSADGSFIDSLGTQGRGPGEFERPSQVFFARDSLYVLDRYYGELSSFGPNREFERRLSLHAQSRPVQILTASTTLVGVYERPFLPDHDSLRNLAIRTMSFDGTAGDTLFTAPPPQIHVEQGDDYVRFRQIPFARSPHVTADPTGHVHYAWSDSLTVMRYDQTGHPRDTVDIPYTSVSITEADREQALAERPPETKKAVRDEIPSTKPAFDHFLVDDQGRYWFGRPTSNPDSTAWWVTQPDKQRVLTDTLTSDVEILNVQDGHAYGRTTTETGAPALVRYRIQTSE
jgi:hypothetical protein